MLEIQSLSWSMKQGLNLTTSELRKINSPVSSLFPFWIVYLFFLLPFFLHLFFFFWLWHFAPQTRFISEEVEATLKFLCPKANIHPKELSLFVQYKDHPWSHFYAPKIRIKASLKIICHFHMFSLDWKSNVLSPLPSQQQRKNHIILGVLFNKIQCRASERAMLLMVKG